MNDRVPRIKLTRRLGPIGAALTLWDIWRRLPPPLRKRLAKHARKHGPRVAKQVWTAKRKGRRLKP